MKRLEEPQELRNDYDNNDGLNRSISRLFISFNYKSHLMKPIMSAKILGILAMVYAVGELKNPLSCKTMLCEGDINNPASIKDGFLFSYFWQAL